MKGYKFYAFVLILLAFPMGETAKTATVCDCKNMEIKGIVDLKPPEYCNHAEPYRHAAPRKMFYNILTSDTFTYKFIGHVCEMYIREKKITGSFWIGSYDTEYHEYSVPVAEEDCKRMVTKRLCGESGTMLEQEGHIFKYTAVPDGPPKWFTTKIYTTTNCVTWNVTLSQESATSDIVSPFGNLSSKYEKGFDTFNNKIISWDVQKDTKGRIFGCRLTPVLKNVGVVTTTKKQGRLVDKTNQIEVLFDTTAVSLCTSPMNDEGKIYYPIFGIKNTYLTLNESIDYVHDRKRRQLPMDEDKIITTNNVSGAITLDSFPGMYVDKLNNTSSLVIQKRTDINKFFSFDGWSGFNSEDNKLKIQDSNECVVVKRRQVMYEECQENSTEWIYDEERKMIIEMTTGNCLTAQLDGFYLNGSITIMKCNTNDIINDVSITQQKWNFWHKKPKPEIKPKRVRRKHMIFDFDKEEDADRFFAGDSPIHMNPTETYPFGWGKIRNDNSGNSVTGTMCIRVKGEQSPMKLKKCDSTLSVIGRDWFQEFEHMEDLTIRPLGSDYCMTALNPSRTIHAEIYLRPRNKLPLYEPWIVILEECRLSATRWVLDNETGQLVGFDVQTGDTGCLTRQGEKDDLYLFLRPCQKKLASQVEKILPDDRQIWQFEFRQIPRKMEITASLAKEKRNLRHYLKHLGQDKPEETMKLERIIHMGRTMRMTPATASMERKMTLTVFNTSEELEELLSLRPTQAIGIEGGENGNRDLIDASYKLQSGQNDEGEPGSGSGKPDQTISSITGTTSEISPEFENKTVTFKDLKEALVNYILPMHEQFKVGQQFDMSNQLANEIRRIYCEIATNRRKQLMTLAQISPLLAGSTLGEITTECSRIEGRGATLILQKCTPKQVNITAIATRCGMEPIFEYENSNATIGVDGWSITPFTTCLHRTNFIDINGKPHVWKHEVGDNLKGNWTLKEPDVHGSNTELISRFEEFQVNDYDYQMLNHGLNELNHFEHLNILMEMVGRAYEYRDPNIRQLMSQGSALIDMSNEYSWTDKIQIIVVAIIAIIILALTIKLCTFCNPIPKIDNRIRKILRKRDAEFDLEKQNAAQSPPSESQGTAITSLRERWYGGKHANAKSTNNHRYSTNDGPDREMREM